MTERNWWTSHVRPALNRPAERCLAEKVQDAFKKGAPDVDMIARGAVMKLELKFVKALPQRDTGLPYDLGCTAEQKIWLESWYQAGGRSAVLLGVEDGQALLIGWKHARESLTFRELNQVTQTLTWKGKWPWAPLSVIPRLLAQGALDAVTAVNQDSPRITG